MASHPLGSQCARKLYCSRQEWKKKKQISKDLDKVIEIYEFFVGVFNDIECLLNIQSIERVGHHRKKVVRKMVICQSVDLAQKYLQVFVIFFNQLDDFLLFEVHHIIGEIKSQMEYLVQFLPVRLV